MIPVIIGGVILATGLTTGGYNGVRAYGKKKKADTILKKLEKRIKVKNKESERAYEEFIKVVSALDNIYLEVYNKDFKKLEQVFSLIKKQVHFKKGTDLASLIRNADTEITEISIQRENLNATKDVLATVGTSGTAGALSLGGAVAFATTFGTASTGTAIGSLSGVAYTNALLAYFGGGSLAAGGLGMTGGIAVLGGIAAAPVIAIVGIGANFTAEKHLTKIKEYEKEVEKEIANINMYILETDKKRRVIKNYIKNVQKIRNRFNLLLNELEELVSLNTDKIQIENKLEVVMEFARTLKSLIDKPLEENLKESKNGESLKA